ncbi:MAG: 2-oxoglutarate ferredoxin oxidoreductase subunit gamma [Desulfitibacter sp. BRH_c19]|nr:MAG: 2-oxoglutarate ferredoxin oxidoreductase subunit gamma [Desulfitibacter sp. BRH_c19]
MNKEVRLSGSGGQGIILAGIILAEAGIIDGKNVLQTQSYGPEARGGASKAEVIIGEDDIDYPKVITPDIVLAMTQEAANKYITSLKDNGLVLVDSTYVINLPDFKNIYQIPITKIAKNDVGKGIVSNMVALGALVGLTEVVTFEALQRAVLARIPKGTEELNKKALNLGYEAGVELAESGKKSLVKMCS